MELAHRSSIMGRWEAHLWQWQALIVVPTTALLACSLLYCCLDTQLVPFLHGTCLHWLVYVCSVQMGLQNGVLAQRQQCLHN